MDIRSLDNFPVRATGQAAPPGDTQVVETRPIPAVRGVDPGAVPVQPTASVQTREEGESRKELGKVAEGVNAVLENSGSHVRFVLHERAKQMMVQIRDNTTDEVIRTIPSKELLDLAAKIGEMIGVLVDKKT
jgi:flagellar protein FlaG